MGTLPSPTRRPPLQSPGVPLVRSEVGIHHTEFWGHAYSVGAICTSPLADRDAVPGGGRPRRYAPLAGPRSSAGQSAGLLSRMPQVRVLPGALRQPSQRTLDWKAPGGRSSVGRAPGCGPGGRRFESGRSPLTKPPTNRRGFCCGGIGSRPSAGTNRVPRAGVQIDNEKRVRGPRRGCRAVGGAGGAVAPPAPIDQPNSAALSESPGPCRGRPLHQDQQIRHLGGGCRSAE
jgi:hypothetical protein